MATVSKRGNAYRIKVSCGYNSQGKQVNKTMTWRPDPKMTQRQIEKELQRQVVMFEDKCVHGHVSACIKFQAFAEQWFRDYAELNHKDTTLQRERNLSKRTYKEIGHLRMDKITARDIQFFINNLVRYGVNLDNGKPLAYKTIRHHLSFVSAIFEYAIKLDILNYNPCQKVTVPRNIKNRTNAGKEKKIYTKEQARELLKMLSESTMMFRVYFTQCMFTGCRRGELLGMEWKDFDYTQNVVHICRISNYSLRKGMYTDTPKTEKSNRIIALPPEIMELVKQFKSERDIYIKEMGTQWNDTE